MEKPLYVAISSQKGGAGKSTISAVLASYLYFEKKVDLAVIDCDYPQWSLFKLRERDMRLVEKSGKVKKIVHETWKSRGVGPYEIYNTTPEDAAGYLDLLTEESEMTLQVILVDLPGTVYNPNVINLIKKMDYIFCPMTTDPLVFETSLAFASNVQEKFISTGQAENLKGLYMLWNRVASRERDKLQTHMEGFIGRMGIPVLNTALPDSSRFRKEGQGEKRFSVFRSTILPPDRQSLKGSGIEDLAEEITGIIGL